MSASDGESALSSQVSCSKWERRLASWIRRFCPGLRHWWTWLSAIGLDPESPALVVRYQSKPAYTGHGVPVSIPTPLLPPDVVPTTTAWRLTWYAMIRPGSERSGDIGAGHGVVRQILCILEYENVGPARS